MYEKELRVAKDLANKAGELMRKNFVAIGHSEKVWKEDNSPVTVTDKAINSLVISEVAEKFPNHTVLGEEESSSVPHGEFVWVVDPIDGTIPFSHGWPTSVFTLALCKNGKPVVAVIYDPYFNRLYEAIEGSPTLLNGEETSVSTESNIKKGYHSINAWPSAPYDFKIIKNNVMNARLDALDVGSVTYMYMLIASGQMLSAVFAGINSWDSAAAKLIIENAGGKVTDLFGNDQLYDREIKGVIASNGLIHNELVSIVSKGLS